MQPRAFLLIPLLIAAASYPALAQKGSPEADIRAVLADQTAAWNRGDLDAFVEGYLDSPDILFVGKEVARGRAQLLDRYRRVYGSREKMGTLTFSGLEVHLLDSKFATVVGRFHLQRSAAGGSDADGVFTLLFQKTPKGWKIIQDHTS